MHLKKILLAIICVFLAVTVGYKRDAFSSILEQLWAKSSSLIAKASTLPGLSKISPEPNGQPPQVSGGLTKGGVGAPPPRPAGPGLASLQGQASDKQVTRQGQYLEKLKQQMKDFQGDKPEEEELMDNSEEDEEIVPEQTDPYAQFRRPPNSNAPQERSSFENSDTGEDEEVVDESDNGDTSTDNSDNGSDGDQTTEDESDL